MVSSTKAHLDVREDASLLEGLTAFQWDQALGHEDDPTKTKEKGAFLLCTQVRHFLARSPINSDPIIARVSAAQWVPDAFASLIREPTPLCV